MTCVRFPGHPAGYLISATLGFGLTTKVIIHPHAMRLAAAFGG